MERHDNESYIFDIVSRARNEIISENSSAKDKYDSLEKVCSFLAEFPGSTNAKDSKDIFENDYYYEFLIFLLNKFDITWLKSNDTQGKKIEYLVKNFILFGPSEQAFIAMANFLHRFTYDDFKLQKVILWLQELLQNNCINKAIVLRCKQCQKHEDLKSSCSSFQDFIQMVSSLPEIILSKGARAGDVDYFVPDNYLLVVSDNIYSMLLFCCKRLEDNHDTSVVPISKLIGKLCIVGYGAKLWNYVIKLTSKHLEKNMLWRRVIQQIISNIDDWCLEATVVPLIFGLKDSNAMNEFFGDLPAKKKKLETILTYKLILCRFFSDCSSVKYILIYLKTNPDVKHLFEKIFVSILDAWCHKTLVKFRPFEQNLYLCKIMLIVISLSADDEGIGKVVKEKAQKALLNGLPLYLDSSVLEVRQMGTIVANSLASLVHPGVAKLDLPVEKNEFTQQLLSYLDVGKINNVSEEERVSNTNPTEEIRQSPYIDSDDDDDQLQPCQSEAPMKKIKKPIYLAQCIEGLLNYDDPEYMEECLKSCESLVAKHPELDSLHKEMCKVLLHLENRCSIKDFYSLRYNVMLLLLTTSPEAIADYLSSEFNEAHYNLSQRFDILDILTEGAKKLSFPGQKVKNPDERVEVLKKSQPPTANNWQEIIEQRIEMKTKRFSKNTTKVKPVAVPNRLSTCVGWFFYPLMKNYDMKSDLNFQGQEYLLLEKLLNSLATILYCSINVSNSATMAKTLLQFTSCFRLHNEVGIRRAVLNASCICLIVLDASYSLPSVVHELVDLQSWLNTVIRHDCDSQCVHLANQTFSFLKSFQSSLLKQI